MHRLDYVLSGHCACTVPSYFMKDWNPATDVALFGSRICTAVLIGQDLGVILTYRAGVSSRAC